MWLRTTSRVDDGYIQFGEKMPARSHGMQRKEWMMGNVATARGQADGGLRGRKAGLQGRISKQAGESRETKFGRAGQGRAGQPGAWAGYKGFTVGGESLVLSSMASRRSDQIERWSRVAGGSRSKRANWRREGAMGNAKTGFAGLWDFRRSRSSSSGPNGSTTRIDFFVAEEWNGDITSE